VYQYKRVIDVTKSENFTQCPWIFEAKIKVTFKHYPRTPNGCGRSIAITLKVILCQKYIGNKGQSIAIGCLKAMYGIDHNISFKHPLAFGRSLKSFYN